MLSLIVGGDIVPSFKNIEPFNLGKVAGLVDEKCQRILSSADFRVFNLETPLTDTCFPIDKEGANFAANSQTVQGLKALNIDVLGLANNHCKDQGADGLLKTIEILRNNDITPIGYGTGFESCEGVTFLSKDGITVAVLTCAETEFTVWSDGEIGAIPYHDYYTNRMIAEAKKRADAVVVLYHGGKEYFTYAAPYQIDRCHLMVDSGADYILCQHSHCICCYEEYNGGTILYGQGNFIFHQKNNFPQTKEGLLAKISVDKQSKSIDWIPIYLDENDRACLIEGQSALMEAFNKRSIRFCDDGVAQSEYHEFALKKAEEYYTRLQGSNHFLFLIRKVLKKMKIEIYRKQDKLKLLNLLQNEAHRELFIQALKEDIKASKGE